MNALARLFNRRPLVSLLCGIGLGLTQAAQAGQACGEKPMAVEDARKAYQLAYQVREALDQSGAQVVILGRVGQDLSKYGLRYSHAGIIWRDHPSGRWLAVHELNECGTAVSNLYDQGLANFFADDLYAWDALVITPSPATQEKLAAVLRASKGVPVHEARYNMVAYPFSSKYQNSNQWVLETLGSALSDQGISDRDTVQRWLQGHGYLPTTLEISPLTRLGGRMFRANVAFDDHPGERRMAGKIDTVTVESIERFLQRQDPETRRDVVRLTPL